MVQIELYNPDFTLNVVPAAMMGWTLRDPTAEELPRTESISVRGSSSAVGSRGGHGLVAGSTTMRPLP